MTDTIVLYHANCTDGAGSMWSAWKFFKDAADYIAVGKLSKKQSNILKKCKAAARVYMCDMMLDMESIEDIASSGTKVYLLDHHLSNINLLNNTKFTLPACNNIENHCDMSRSGAGITWDYFHKTARPTIIDYIEDFDLWAWKMPDGQSIHTYLSQFNWKTNQDIIDQFNAFATMSPGHMAEKGTPLVNYRTQLIERNISQVGRATIQIGTDLYNVPILNGNHFISETGNVMAEGEKFAAIWQQMADGTIRMSLRSDQNGLDVHTIAARLGDGGGGHEHAAGTSFVDHATMLMQVSFI